MRMDPTTGRGAEALVNEAPMGELADLFRANGEERLAGRLARAVVAGRPLTSTAQLADVVEAAVPAAIRRRGHPGCPGLPGPAHRRQRRTRPAGGRPAGRPGTAGPWAVGV